MNLNAVGIDVSKRKSTIAVLRPGGQVLMKPFDVSHHAADFQTLADKLKALDGETRIVMECTGHYYEPVARELSQAGFFVSAVNPQIINNFQGRDNPLRKVKTYPGANTYFDSPAREDGSQKWVDFLDTYWHVDCVRKMSLQAFTDHYQKWCNRKKYNFRKAKAEEIYGIAKELIPVLPKDNFTKRIIKQAIAQVNAASQTVEQLRSLMNETASKLPEYPVVMAMKGVGLSLGPQLMAEIGDVTRFTHKGAVTAFAGVDPGVNDSGDYSQKSVHASKHGSPVLRKTLFQIMDILIKTKPDDAVYLFMDKKRAEGKPYYVYMTAGANKFLRVYYGRVKEYLSTHPESD